MEPIAPVLRSFHWLLISLQVQSEVLVLPPLSPSWPEAVHLPEGLPLLTCTTFLLPTKGSSECLLGLRHTLQQFRLTPTDQLSRRGWGWAALSLASRHMVKYMFIVSIFSSEPYYLKKVLGKALKRV